MELTASYIDSLAPNPSAIANGKGLVKKGKFQNLQKTTDGTLIFGECAGSGKKGYSCSMDFLDNTKPVPRCNCPSRQYPCKHVMGLMYAYAQGEPFAEGEVPEDVAAKRENTEKRAETKAKKAEKIKTENAAPSKAKITASGKKIDIQLEGITIADKLLKNIMHTGLAGLDARALKALGEQIKQLGNYRIKGIQTAFQELHFRLITRDENTDYAHIIPQVIFICALLKKAREHLTTKKASNSIELNLDSEIEEQIDHIWKLEELQAYGKFISQAEIIQLSFNVYDDVPKREFTDTGYFLCLQDGAIYTTKNYRPYKSAKHINQDDSIMSPLVAETLYIYPGGVNPRVRFSKYVLRDWKPEDYTTIQKYASDDFSATVKMVKNQIKTPLSDKNPVVLLKINDISYLKDTNKNDRLYASITDSKGTSQLLQGDTLSTMMLFDTALLKGHSILVRYENDITTGLLTAHPLSIVTNDRIIRLEY